MQISDFTKGLSRDSELTHEELVELAKRVQQGDVNARTQMIESNMPLVIAIASRNFHKSKHLGHDDIIQQGVLGLITAVDRYDPYKLNPKNNKPYKFSTYAVWWIEHHIQHGLQFLEDEIHVPFDRLKESGFDNPISHSLDDPQIDEKTQMEILESDQYVIDDIAVYNSDKIKSLLESAEISGLEREILKLSGGLVDGIERSDREIAALLGEEVKNIGKIKRKAREKVLKVL